MNSPQPNQPGELDHAARAAEHELLAAKNAPLADEGLGELTELPGIGPHRAQRLAKLGVSCVRDLLMLQPRRVVVWPAPVPCAEARDRVGHWLRVAGKVSRVRLSRLTGKRSLLRVRLQDESGELEALFFNQPWVREQVQVGAAIEVAGRVVFAGGFALAAPRLGTERKPLPAVGAVVPEYPSTEGLSEQYLRELCQRVTARYAELLSETLPAEWLAERALPDLPEAVRSLHEPSDALAFQHASERLALEPLLAFQARLFGRRDAGETGRALPVEVTEETHRELLALYPFELTPSQLEVVAELRQDLGSTRPMRRLLQGDVGSGKTAVALYAALAVARCGGQVAFMAPTELLAEQHRAALEPMLAQAGVSSVLLTGSASGPERRRVLRAIESGKACIAFGTHALFGRGVRFERLGLALIDEQHRFGVGQRAALTEKGEDVHLLLMSATPIPRTLALTIYGDLDVSLVRHAPPGRGDLRTTWVSKADKAKVPAFLQKRLDAGERVFWVCPRIAHVSEEEQQALAESDASEDHSAADRVAGSGRQAAPLASAERRYEQLLRSPLSSHGAELVHGRMEAEERAARLARFRSGEVRFLVATTVIEVGVDVPEATVMVIENAERLGLAQLHQLRGRVGRGSADSYCLLYGHAVARERLELLVRSRDGFELAEEDLRLRGMGDLAGLRQSGANSEGLADLDAQVGLLMAARDLVRNDARVRALYAHRSGGPVTP